MNVAVYSGSFDPLHIGHLSIMRHLSLSGEFDEVRLVVSPQSPFKDAGKALNARQRYRAACIAVAKYPELKVRVDDIELKMPAPQYTIKTLDALKRNEPENDFTLIIGADNLFSFDKWQEAGRIIDEYGLAVFPRKGFDIEAIKTYLHFSSYSPDLVSRIITIDSPLVDISSTFIRDAQLRGEDVSHLLM